MIRIVRQHFIPQVFKVGSVLYPGVLYESHPSRQSFLPPLTLPASSPQKHMFNTYVEHLAKPLGKSCLV